MDKRMWMWYFAAIGRTLRAMAFEKPYASAGIVWCALVLLPLVLAFSLSVGLGALVLVAAIAAFVPFRRWVHHRIYKLIRPADQIEFVDTNKSDDWKQAFDVGIVVTYMHREHVRQSGGFDKMLLEDFEHYFLIEKQKKNLIVPLEWILGIELDTGGESS